MTTEEQKNVIGGVVLEYSEVKQKLVALRQELRNKVKLINDFAQVVDIGNLNKGRSYLEAWPDAEFFSNTFNQIEENERRRTELEQTMKEYGLNLQ